tara:strand:- start:1226 stop:1585 length:360 start_codon:yes stop_codon:yes gene_type:complete
MAKFGKDIDPMVGKATQFPHNDPTKGGKPVSIKTQVKDLLESEGNITIPSNQVVKINDDGSVVMKVPTQMQIAMKLQSWAMSKKGTDSLKAIQMIMEQIDGKAKETKDISINREQPLFD